MLYWSQHSPVIVLQPVLTAAILESFSLTSEEVLGIISGIWNTFGIFRFLDFKFLNDWIFFEGNACQRTSDKPLKPTMDE